MGIYILKRVLRSFVTLFLVCTIVFCLLRLMPIEGYFNNFDKMTPEQVQHQLEIKGLTDPLPTQLGRFYNDLLHGDLGNSSRYRPGIAITEILADRIPISMLLGVISLVISLILGIPLGRLMTRYKGRIPDHIGTVFIVAVQAVPAVVYYLFIQMYGTDALGLPMLFSRDNLATYILPVFSLALGNIAGYGMWVRRYMIDESNKDYVKLAIAKGVDSKSLMSKHIFRNAFVPLVQSIPRSFILTIVGSIYVESLYSVPGMGGLLVKAIQTQDNTLVQALVLIYSMLSIVGLILGDIAMTIADPRISFAKKGGAR